MTPFPVSAGIEVQPCYTLRQLVLYFLKLGAIGFGGPIALVGYMHRDLVQERGWITDADYKEGLALSQMAPGPLAAQLAIYLGFVHYRVRGATQAALAFVLPSFVMVLARSWAYVRYGGLAWMRSVYYGVGAAVIGIIAISAYKLTTRSIGKDKLLWGIFVALVALTIVTESEIAALFIAAGVLVWLIRRKPRPGGATPLSVTAAPAALAAFAITAAAIGAIAGSVVMLGRRSIVDLPTTLLAVGAAFVLWRFKAIKEPIVVVVAALIGLLAYPLAQD